MYYNNCCEHQTFCTWVRGKHVHHSVSLCLCTHSYWRVTTIAAARECLSTSAHMRKWTQAPLWRCVCACVCVCHSLTPPFPVVKDILSTSRYRCELLEGGWHQYCCCLYCRACFVPHFDQFKMEMLKVYSLDDLHSLSRDQWGIRQPRGVPHPLPPSLPYSFPLLSS